MNARSDEVKAWLQKAVNDVRSARILLEHDPPVLETACFHCQQGVEKALKAFLVWKAIPFEKVRSLSYLLDLCERQEPAYGAIREQTETLAPYAVEVRYPGDIMEVSRAEAEAALATAEAVWQFVLSFIPSELSPPFSVEGST